MRRPRGLAALALGTALSVTSPAGAAEPRVTVAGAFTLAAPADTTVQSDRSGGTAGIIAAGTLRIIYDYGVNADPLTNVPTRRFLGMEQLAVDGHPALLAIWEDQAGRHVGLHVPAIAATPLGPLRLTLTGPASDAAAEQALRALFLSVRFLPPRL